jgi:hypothetical protein
VTPIPKGLVHPYTLVSVTWPCGGHFGNGGEKSFTTKIIKGNHAPPTTDLRHVTGIDKLPQAERTVWHHFGGAAVTCSRKKFSP